MPPDLQIYILGSFRLTVKGAAVSNSAWQKRKAKLLVKILALKQSHELHREELIEILFPNTDLIAANDNLYRILYAARRALEPKRGSYISSNYLITEGQQIKLAAANALWIDAEEFEQKARNGLKTNNQEFLESAAELYRGDLLLDEPFEEWVTDDRDRFRTLFHLVLRRLAENAERQNTIQEAHHWLDKILQHEPADEIAHRGKIRLYAEQGDTTLAMRQYEKCREMLRRELAVEPGEETRQMRQKILVTKQK